MLCGVFCSKNCVLYIVKLVVHEAKANSNLFVLVMLSIFVARIAVRILHLTSRQPKKMTKCETTHAFVSNFFLNPMNNFPWSYRSVWTWPHCTLISVVRHSVLLSLILIHYCAANRIIWSNAFIEGVVLASSKSAWSKQGNDEGQKTSILRLIFLGRYCDHIPNSKRMDNNIKRDKQLLTLKTENRSNWAIIEKNPAVVK